MGFEDVLGIAPRAGEPSSIDVRVAEDREAWIDTVVTGFEHPDEGPASRPTSPSSTA